MEEALAAEVGNSKPLVGWRAWRVIWSDLERGEDGLWRHVKSQPRLVSWTSEFVWPPFRALTAAEGAHGTCKKAPPGHPVRSSGCSCGVYAFKGKAALVRSLKDEISDDVLVAFGRVSLWGNWVGGKRGWRAEYAYPYDIKVVSTQDTAIARAIASAYAVDVSYGVWDIDAELADIKHDCATEGHLYGRGDDQCLYCHIPKRRAATAATKSRAARVGIEVPTFPTRKAALAWFTKTAEAMMDAGRAAGDVDGAKAEIAALSDIMRPVLDRYFVTPIHVRPVTPLMAALDRGLKGTL